MRSSTIRYTVVGLVAFFLRFWVLIHNRPAIVSDMVAYRDIAQSLLTSGHYLWYGHSSAYWPPGYPFFLALCLAVYHHYTFVRAVQVVLGALTAVTMAVLADRLYGPYSSWFAGLVYAIDTPFVVYTQHLLTETLFFFTWILSFALFFHGLYSGKTRWFVLSGLLCGISCLIRPAVEGIPFGMLAYVVLFDRSHWKKAVLFLAFAGLAVMPWTLRNYAVFHQFVPIVTNGGVNFYIAHNPHENGLYNFDAKTVPFHEPLYTHETAHDRLGYRLGWEHIRTDPQKEWYFTKWKLKKYFTETQDDLLEGIRVPFRFPALIDGLYIFSVLALFRIADWRKNIFWAGIALYNVLLICVVFYFSTRYRYPMDVALILLASACFARRSVNAQNHWAGRA